MPMEERRPMDPLRDLFTEQVDVHIPGPPAEQAEFPGDVVDAQTLQAEGGGDQGRNGLLARARASGYADDALQSPSNRCYVRGSGAAALSLDFQCSLNFASLGAMTAWQ